MPKKVAELKPLQVQRLASVEGFHNVGGVAGLHLQVKGGSSAWVLRATVGNRRRDIGLGGYPDVTLAQARDRARDAREKIRQGVDPVEERKAARAALVAIPTFDWCAKQVIAKKRSGKQNAKHVAQWETTLATYANPIIGEMPVDRIEIRHIVDVLTPIWTVKTETANRVRGRIEAVLDWAKVAGYRSGDNPAEWRGNLQHLFESPRRVTKVKHYRALPIDEMHGFMVALRARDGLAARALEFAILTAARSGEVRGATWAEIDLERAVWTIPGERMKAGKEHRVPLSEAAVAVLRALPRFAGTELVFPGQRGRPLSDMSLLKITRTMEVDAVPHGFRSTFRDWAAERTKFPGEMAELALAHTIGDKVEASYRRGDMFAKRAEMMTAWSKFIDTPPATGNVHHIRQKAS